MEEELNLSGLRRDLADRVREIKRQSREGRNIPASDVDFLIELLESGLKWGNDCMDEWAQEVRKVNKISADSPSQN